MAMPGHTSVINILLITNINFYVKPESIFFWPAACYLEEEYEGLFSDIES